MVLSSHTTELQPGRNDYETHTHMMSGPDTAGIEDWRLEAFLDTAGTED